MSRLLHHSTSRRRLLVRTVFISLVGFAILAVDLGPPWWGQALVTATTSSLYSSTGQEQTEVVLFTEDDLMKRVKPTEAPFPIPYRLHAEVITAIAYTRPAAIFIDFAFLQKNLTDAVGYEALRQAVCNAHDRRVEEGSPDRFVKVFIVDTSRLGIPGVEAETFGGCAIPVGAFIDKERVASGVMTYPKSGSPEDGAARIDVPAGDACACAHGECGKGLSAAYALWLATRPCVPGQSVVLPEGEHMTVVWPARPPPRETAVELCEKPSGLGERFLQLLHEGPQALKRGCPYSRTFTAEDVLPPIKDNDLDKYLHDHVVFYGAKLAMAGDVVRSPVFSEQPAIYYHAVAFDNLVTFEGKPKEPAGPPGMLWFAAVVIGTAFYLASKVQPPRVVAASPAQSLKSLAKLARSVFLLIAFAAFLTLVAILLQVFSRINAPEYLFLAAFVIFLVDRFVKTRLMGAISLCWFLVSVVSYVWLQLGFDRFFAMILFFEVAHLMLEHLSTAAHRIRRFYHDPPTGPRRYSERIAMVVLEPFLPNKEHS